MVETKSEGKCSLELTTRDSVDSEWSHHHDIEAQIPQTITKVVPFQERHPLEYYTVVFGSAILAFNAGYINGITFQFASVGVSYVSGTSLKIGVKLGLGLFYKFSLNVSLLFAFIFGCVITGFLMPSDSFKLGRKYGPLFLLGAGFLAIAFALSHSYPTSNLFIFFAAIGCGIQNSMISKYSGNIIRTAHMSGISTDMGIVFGRYLRKGKNSDLWKLTVFVPMLVSFILGGLASVPAYSYLGKEALFVNVVLFVFLGVTYSIIVGRELQIPAWRIYLGMYERLKATTKKIKHRFRLRHHFAKKMPAAGVKNTNKRHNTSSHDKHSKVECLIQENVRSTTVGNDSLQLGVDRVSVSDGPRVVWDVESQRLETVDSQERVEAAVCEDEEHKEQI